jgi:hypothetical protein
MKLLSRKRSKNNILELSEPDKIRLMSKAREELKETRVEAKLWQMLLNVDNLMVNGNLVCGDKQQLSSLSLEDVL